MKTLVNTISMRRDGKNLCTQQSRLTRLNRLPFVRQQLIDLTRQLRGRRVSHKHMDDTHSRRTSINLPQNVAKSKVRLNASVFSKNRFDSISTSVLAGFSVLSAQLARPISCFRAIHGFAGRTVWSTEPYSSSDKKASDKLIKNICRPFHPTQRAIAATPGPTVLCRHRQQM